jgi:Putative adhesin
MKKIFYLLSTLTVLLTNCSSGVAQPWVDGPTVEKKKNITQSYDLSSSDRVSLKNKFGSIKVNTWNENRIKVIIDIEVAAKTEDKATKVIDGITISHGKDGNLVSFKTIMEVFENSNMNNRKKKSTVTSTATNGKTSAKANASIHSDSDDENTNDCGECPEGNYNNGTHNYRNNNGKNWENQTMTVNYTVYLPSNATMKLYNEFGDVTIPDYTGALDVHTKFGNFTADALSNNDNEVLVEFGNANIKSLTNPDLTVKFGECDLADVTGKGSLTFDFSGDVNVTLNKNVGDLKIKNSYSTLDITLHENTNAKFDIKSSYGEVKNKNTKLNMKSDEDEDENDNKSCCDFTKVHTGTIGSGTAMIVINNSYGKIKFR